MIKNSKLMSNFELWRASASFDQLDSYTKLFVRFISFKRHRNLTELCWLIGTFSKFSVVFSPSQPKFQKVPKSRINPSLPTILPFFQLFNIWSTQSTQKYIIFNENVDVGTSWKWVPFLHEFLVEKSLNFERSKLTNNGQKMG